MTSKIIKFPCPNEYLNFIASSKIKLNLLIQILNTFNNRKDLDKEKFQIILNEAEVLPERDFTYQDHAILQFHIDNYYDLDIQV